MNGGAGESVVRETYVPESEVVPFPPRLDEVDKSRGLGSLA